MKIVIPVLEKIIHICDHDLFLMNMSSISSIKYIILIILQIIPNRVLFNEINEIVINFIYTLLIKFIKFPTLFLSVIVSNSTISNDYDYGIFQLVIEIFSQEFYYKKREVKAKIRKSMLLCFDLDYFSSEGNRKNISKFLESLIVGLQVYYKDFRDFDVNTYLTKVITILKFLLIT